MCPYVQMCCFVSCRFETWQTRNLLVMTPAIKATKAASVDLADLAALVDQLAATG